MIMLSLLSRPAILALLRCLNIINTQIYNPYRSTIQWLPAAKSNEIPNVNVLAIERT